VGLSVAGGGKWRVDDVGLGGGVDAMVFKWSLECLFSRGTLRDLGEKKQRRRGVVDGQ
jgi:hypothetical protein